MGEFVVKMVARLIARKVERGSVKGAWVGATSGLIGAIGLGWLMQSKGWVDSMVAPTIALSMGLMIAGALWGSMLGPRRAVMAGADEMSRRDIRLTRYNKGLVPMFYVVVAAAFWMYWEFSPRGPAGGTDGDFYVRLGCGAVAGVALLVQSRAVLWIEVGPAGVIIGRLIGSRLYRADEIERVAMAGAPEGEDLFLVSADAGLAFRFRDGRSYSIGVPVDRVNQVVASLVAAGVRAPGT